MGKLGGDSDSREREYVLIRDCMHGEHPGMSRMKAIARTLVWWPRKDQDIKGMVRRCEECQTNNKHHLHMLHFIHGSGLTDHGPNCT